MKKVLVVLAIGVALGYTWGWHDAQVNDDDIVTRIVSQVGGSTRGELKNDPDHMLDSLSR